MTEKENSLLSALFSMRDKMERVLSEREAAVVEERKDGESLPDWQPQVDLYESDTEFVVLAEVPGVASEDFTLTIHDRNLVLEGQRRVPRHEDEVRHLQVERSYGFFRRNILLPGEVQVDPISAKLTNGVLEIVISKKAKPEGRRVAVQAET